MSSSAQGQGGGLLALGGFGAILASVCCIGPLLLVSLGLSGAWLASLHTLQPYRWIFIAVATIALIVAWRRLYGRRDTCAPGGVCAAPSRRRLYRILFWATVILVAVTATFPWFAPLFY